MAPPEQHPATDELAMVAVAPDDPRLERVRTHVRRCAACAEEVAQLSAALAPGPDGPARRLPAPSVWEGIAAATGVRSAPDEAAVLRSLDDGDGSARSGSAGARAVPAPDPVGTSLTAPPAGTGQTSPPSSSSPAVTGLPAQRSRQRWSTPVLLAAAGLALVVGATSGALVASRTRDPGAAVSDPVAGAVVVSSAQLRPLAADQGAWTGTAEVVTREDGQGRRVLVSTEGLPPVQGAAYEVWLLDATTGGVVSLGALAEGQSPQGGYVLPDGVDLARFSEVDVSAEPLDGQAGHSGVSELRGALTTDATASTVSA
ncbi:MAG: anti-sigma factor [Quadrisphaera sp.]